MAPPADSNRERACIRARHTARALFLPLRAPSPIALSSKCSFCSAQSTTKCPSCGAFLGSTDDALLRMIPGSLAASMTAPPGCACFFFADAHKPDCGLVGQAGKHKVLLDSRCVAKNMPEAPLE